MHFNLGTKYKLMNGFKLLPLYPQHPLGEEWRKPREGVDVLARRKILPLPRIEP
jgi:hypothetical protein